MVLDLSIWYLYKFYLPKRHVWSRTHVHPPLLETHIIAYIIFSDGHTPVNGRMGYFIFLSHFIRLCGCEIALMVTHWIMVCGIVGTQFETYVYSMQIDIRSSNLVNIAGSSYIWRCFTFYKNLFFVNLHQLINLSLMFYKSQRFSLRYIQFWSVKEGEEGVGPPNLMKTHQWELGKRAFWSKVEPIL